MTLSTPSPLHRLARLGWYPTLAIALGILLASIPGYLFNNPMGIFEGRIVVQPGPATPLIFGLISLVSFGSASFSMGLAALLFARKSSDRMGLFLSYFLLAYGILLAGPIEQLQPLWPAAPMVNSFVFLPILLGPLTVTLIGIFPDGRFVPPWTRWLVPLSLIIFTVSYLTSQDLSSIEFTLSSTILVGFGTLVSVPLVLAVVYAQIYRYRRVSSPPERQQAKVVLYGIALWFSLMLLSSFGWVWAFSQPPGTPAPWWFPVGSFVWTASTLVLPVSLTIAVLRYRLFEIDIVIRRTLVYGALTGCLALIYFVSVVLLQGLLTAVGSPRTAVATVLSTLAIAALFAPLRRRIQGFIDRRYYRRRYDAEKALAAFSLSVRDEVVIESLSLALLAVVDETMQPERLSIWLKAPPHLHSQPDRGRFPLTRPAGNEKSRQG